MRQLKLGSRGSDVITLQQKLKILADGHFGPITEKFVERFQLDKVKNDYLVHVSTISIQTGTRANAESDCRAVMQICDNNNKCCQTRTDGGGLDIGGRNDREKGQLDTYTGSSLLNTCSWVGIIW